MLCQAMAQLVEQEHVFHVNTNGRSCWVLQYTKDGEGAWQCHYHAAKDIKALLKRLKSAWETLRTMCSTCKKTRERAGAVGQLSFAQRYMDGLVMCVRH